MMNSEMPIMGMTNNPGTADAEDKAVVMEQAAVAQGAVPVTEPEDDTAFIAELERYPGVKSELSVAQLRAREERRTELENTFSYDDYKVARKELHGGLHDPSILIRAKSITFNQPCITSLEGVSYVRLYFSETLGRLAIRPVAKNTPHAMHWCSESKGKRKPRTVMCPDLAEWFYSTMGWDKNIRYRVLGYMIEVEGETIYVFDFKYAKLYNERQRGEDGKLMPADRKGHYPDEVKKSFTVPVKEFEQTMAVEETNGLINVAMLIGADKLPEQPVEEKQDEPAASSQPVAEQPSAAQETVVSREVAWNDQTPNAPHRMPSVGLVASAAAPSQGLYF